MKSNHHQKRTATLLFAKEKQGDFWGRWWRRECQQVTGAHLLALAECAAGTQWSPEAVPSRHFLLLFLSFEVFQSYKCGGGGGGERCLQTRVQPHTGGFLKIAPRPKGKKRQEEQTASPGEREMGGAGIMNATGGRIWSGTRGWSPPQETPQQSHQPFLIPPPWSLSPIQVWFAGFRALDEGPPQRNVPSSLKKNFIATHCSTWMYVN